MMNAPVKPIFGRSLWWTLLACTLLLVQPVSAEQPKVGTDQRAAFQLVVMDPLSKPLSCDCVKGYAQRQYEALEKHLEKSLGRPVDVVWNASLAAAVKETDGRADLVIGKHSVVLHDAKILKREFQPVASLSGSLGGITQHGLLVVRDKDPAQSVSDLQGYRFFLGTEDAAEKSSAALDLLKANKVTIPEKQECYGACSEAASALLKLPADARAAAVISSYAEPLLEGCGSVKKGDLRIVGKTEPLPFVVAFCPADMPADTRQAVEEALASVAEDFELKTKLETLDGFVPWQEASSSDEDSAETPSESNQPAEENEAVKKK